MQRELASSEPLREWLDHSSRLAEPIAPLLKVALSIVETLSRRHAQRNFCAGITHQSIRVDPIDGSVVIENATTSVGAELSLEQAVYLAPEQSGALNFPVGPSSDLYSLGVLLYQRLSGQNPLAGTTLSELLLSQMTTKVIGLRQAGVLVPSWFDELVGRLLERDPRDRYRSALAVRDDLQSMMGSLGDPKISVAIGRTDPRERLAAPSFVGRKEWIDRFQSFVVGSQNSTYRWLLTSEAGTGKTRLLSEFAKEASASRVIVLEARGVDSEHAKPLEVFENLASCLQSACDRNVVFANYLVTGLQTHQESLQPFLPFLQWRSGVDTRLEDSGPDAFAGRRLRRAVECLLDLLNNQTQTVLLLVDDFDRADELSKEILSNWIHRHSNDLSGSLMFVATAQISDSTDDQHDPIATEILHPLDSAEIFTVLSSMAGIFPEEALRIAAEASGGNITLGISFLQGLIESGKIVHRDGDWIIRSNGPLELESHYDPKHSIENRIGGLSSDAIAFMTASAILGKNFKFQEAQALSQLSLSVSAEILDSAVRRQLLWGDRQQDRAGFVHDETRLAFLNRLSEDDRGNWHQRAAKLILNAESGRFYELAYHYDSAQCKDEAIHYAKLAASHSQRQFALDLAVRYYRMAKRWIPDSDRQNHRELAECIGDVYLSTGDYDSAESSFFEALALVDRNDRRTHISSRLGDVEFKRGRMRHASDYYVEALKSSGVRIPKSWPQMIGGLLLQTAYQAKHSMLGIKRQRTIAKPSERLRWTLLSRLAHTYWFSRGPLWTLYAHLRGMNEAERFQDTPELAKSYSEHAPVCSLLGQFKRAESYSQKSLKIRHDQQDVWGKGQTLSYASVVQLAATRFEPCLELASEAIELLERTGDAWETNMARYQRACALYRLGRFRESMADAQRLHASGVEIGDDQAAGISLDLWVRCAPFQVPADAIQQQAKIHRTDAQSYAQTQIALALLQFRDGHFEHAERSLRDAIARCKLAGHLNTYISPAYSWLATILRNIASDTPRYHTQLYRQRLRALRKAVRDSIRIARKFPADLPHALRESALTNMLTGQTSQAARDLRKSLRIAESLHSPMQAWESLVCLNRLANELKLPGIQLSPAESKRMEQLKQQCADSIRFMDGTTTNVESLSLVDRFDTLIEDGRKIARSLDRSDIFRQTCLAAQHLLRAQVVAIYAKVELETDWQVSECVASDVESRRSIGSKMKDKEFTEQIDACTSTTTLAWDRHNRFQSGSLLATPIRDRNSTIAYLLVGHTELDNLFGNEEMQVAEFISTLAGAALENAEGFEKLQRLNTTLEQRVAERTAAAELRTSELVVSNTALRNTEEQLREAIEVVNAANLAKSRFLATMSHEIRTPLNGILGMTQLAIANSPNDKQTSFLQTIQRSGDALLGLLNDVLDFSKMEAGKMTMESIPFHPHQVIQDGIQLLAVSAWQKGIEVACYLSPEVPYCMLGDAMRLRQVVLNLLGNAIKFTVRGYVEVRMEMVPSDPTRWQIRVIDTGIGISNEKQQTIFESFSQADNSTTRQFGGTGLGLSISMELVRLMNGRIDVQSQANVGSEFSIVLPVQTDIESDRIVCVSNRRLLGQNILILDPCRGSRCCLEQTLTDQGAQVIAFEHWECLESLEKPDLGLFQAILAAGPEATQLQQLASESKIPVWVAHGPTVSIDSEELTLIKPFHAFELIDRLVEIKSRESYDGSAATAQPEPESTTNSNEASLNILVAEDGLVNQCVLVGLLELSAHITSVANNGREAVELIQQSTYDLCLMDLDMPELDGIGATREIRKLGIRVPIYSMTAHHDQQHADQCYEAGMDGFLTKPINPADLQKVLCKIAESKNAPSSVSELD
jgi:signal transduction histidine kinase/CheY-like chemotaxis protein/tetratricopeptide (TPR) repeat protein